MVVCRSRDLSARDARQALVDLGWNLADEWRNGSRLDRLGSGMRYLGLFTTQSIDEICGNRFEDRSSRFQASLDDGAGGLEFDLVATCALANCVIVVHSLDTTAIEESDIIETLAAIEHDLVGSDIASPDVELPIARLTVRSYQLQIFAETTLERLDRLMNHLERASHLTRLVGFLHQKAAEFRLKVLSARQEATQIIDSYQLPDYSSPVDSVYSTNDQGPEAYPKTILNALPRYLYLEATVADIHSQLDGVEHQLGAMAELSRSVMDRQTGKTSDSLNQVMFWIGVATFFFGIVAVLDKYQSSQDFGVPADVAFGRLAVVAAGLTLLAITSLSRSSAITPLTTARSKIRDWIADRSFSFSWLGALVNSMQKRPTAAWYAWFERRVTRLFQGDLLFLERGYLADEDEELMRLDSAEKSALDDLQEIVDTLFVQLDTRCVRHEASRNRTLAAQADGLKAEIYLSLAVNHLQLDRPNLLPSPLLQAAWYLAVMPRLVLWYQSEPETNRVTETDWHKGHFSELLAERGLVFDEDEKSDDARKLEVRFKRELATFIKEEAGIELPAKEVWTAIDRATDTSVWDWDLERVGDPISIAALELRVYLRDDGPDRGFVCADLYEALADFRLYELHRRALD